MTENKFLLYIKEKKMLTRAQEPTNLLEQF